MIHIQDQLKWLATLCFFLLCCFVFSCSSPAKNMDEHDEYVEHDKHVEEQPGHVEKHGDEHNDAVELSDAELEEFSIELLTAGPGHIETKAILTGEIVVNPERLAHIVPRFPGIVKKVRKKVGDSVRSGEVLAVIESNESLAPYNVTSLISGEIIEMHLTLGELVSDNSHAIVVADLDPVWAELSVHQKELEQLSIGQKAEIAIGKGAASFPGEISWISPTLSKVKRTAIARVIVANPDRVWRPGLFVNAEVITSIEEVSFAVLKTALEMFEGKTVLFIKSNNVFAPKPVKLGQEGEDMIEVISGLSSGDVYVSKGGFTLKAELEKGAFGDGHAH